MVKFRKFGYYLVDLYRHTHVIKDYKFLMKSQYWSEDKLHKYRNIKLKNLINQVYNFVPYYKSIFDKLKLIPMDIQSIDDLKLLPILTKDIIKEQPNSFIATNYSKFGKWPKATGGSTGVPLKYYLSYKSLSLASACILRAWNECGYKIGDKIIYFGGASLIGNINYKLQIYYLLKNTIPLSAIILSEKALSLYVQKIRSSKARFMYSYASSAYNLANYILEHNINDIFLTAISTTAEVLLPKYRENIEKAFHCKVYDQYGANDGGISSFECKKYNGFHYNADCVILEAIDDNNKPVNFGLKGNAVVTDLNNFTMPFIRYKLDDEIVLDRKKCSCGRGLPLIKEVRGRNSDYIINNTGEKVHRVFFNHLFTKMEFIRKYQVIQNNNFEIEFHFVIDKERYNNEKFDKIKNIMINKFTNMKININIVDEIAVSNNNKYRYIINTMSD